MPRILTERAKDYLQVMPPHVTDDPNIQAVALVVANELDRLDGAITDVMDSYFPTLAARFLYLWEDSLGIGTPGDLTIPQRQARVLGFLQSRFDIVPGFAWVAALTALIGPTWSWVRHIPGSGTGTPAHTITIRVPYTSSSGRASDLRKLIEVITPANTEIVIDFGHGFLVQDSQLQEQPL